MFSLPAAVLLPTAIIIKVFTIAAHNLQVQLKQQHISALLGADYIACVLCSLYAFVCSLKEPRLDIFFFFFFIPSSFQMQILYSVVKGSAESSACSEFLWFFTRKRGFHKTSHICDLFPSVGGGCRVLAGRMIFLWLDGWWFDWPLQSASHSVPRQDTELKFILKPHDSESIGMWVFMNGGDHVPDEQKASCIATSGSRVWICIWIGDADLCYNSLWVVGKTK